MEQTDTYVPTLDEQRGYWDRRWDTTRQPTEDSVRRGERIPAILQPHGYVVLTTANKLVIERTPQRPDPREHIKKWLGIRDLKALLAPRFDIIGASSTVPMGTQGFLRIVNSPRLNRALQCVVPA